MEFQASSNYCLQHIERISISDRATYYLTTDFEIVVNVNKVSCKHSNSGCIMSFLKGDSGFALNDIFKNVKILEGSNFDDTLIGMENYNIFRPLDGNDKIKGIQGSLDYTDIARQNDQLIIDLNS